MASKPRAFSTASKVDRRVSVETPEQIRFEFELAGVATRMMAYLIDLAIRTGGVVVVSFFVFITAGLVVPELGMGIILIIYFAVEWGYHTLFEWLWNGATLGKRAVRIRVVRTNGVEIDLTRSAMRNLLRAADHFPFAYASGLLVMFFTKTERRLGDLAADTMVIRDESVSLRELPPLPDEAVVLPAGVVEALRLGERDLAIIDEFFRRRHLFSAERAEELAEILSRPAMKRLGLDNFNHEHLLAGVLLAGHERRSSLFDGSSPGAAR